MQTKNQQERGVAYRYYVENAAAHPAIIGVHWFEWLDEPNTGRFDGENYNIGMVDVADQPYAELVDAMKTTHARLLTVHNGKERPVGAEGTCEIKRSLLFEHSRDVGAPCRIRITSTPAFVGR